MARGIIAIDFDGTLLRSDRSISARTHSALSAASDAGWIVTGATGRPRSLAEAVASQVEAMRYLVCLNGSMLVDLGSADVVHDEQFAIEDAIVAGRAIRGALPEVGLAADVDHGQLWEPGFDEFVRLRPLGEPEDDLLHALERHEADHVRKLLAFIVGTTSNSEVHSIVTKVSDAVGDRFGVAHAGLPFVEIGPAGVSKASALARLADLEMVEAARCVAFGDEVNDHEMLEWAGVGVAMGNADELTRDVADVTTASNDQDGVAIYIESLLSDGRS